MSTQVAERARLATLKREMIAAAREVAATVVGEKSRVGDNQFRTLVQLCQEADVPEEIEAFVDYQGARERGWPAPVVHAVQRWLREWRQKAPDADPKELLVIFAYFFGYVAWAVKVARGTARPPQAGPAGGGHPDAVRA